MTYTADDKRFKRYIYVKRRIAKAQGAAKAIGVFYLIATLAVIALFCLGVCKVEGATLTAFEFFVSFYREATTVEMMTGLICATVYAATLVAMAICFIVGLTKCKWLFARKASRLYGFNRNMYAMDDLGKCFSFAFASGLAACYYFALTGINFQVELFGYVYLAVGVVFHFLLGLLGGSVSLFDTTEGITEQKREVGYFAPFMRNLLQIAATGGSLFLFVQHNVVYESLAVISVAMTDIAAAIAEAPFVLVIAVGQIVLAIALIFMIFHSFGTKEFDIEGAETPGRKLFIVWIILALIGAAATYVGATFAKDALSATVMNNALIIAIIAFVSLLIEIFTVGCPHVQYEKLDDMEAKEFIRENANNNQPNVYMHYEVNNTAPAAPNGYTVYGLDD